MRIVVLAFLVAVSGSPCLAEEIFLSSGERFRGILRTLEKDGSARVWIDDQAHRLGPGKIVRVVYAAPEQRSDPEEIVFILPGGSRLFGSRDGHKEPGKASLSGLFGEVDVPFDAVRAVRVPGAGKPVRAGGEGLLRNLLEAVPVPPSEKDVVLFTRGGKVAALKAIVQGLEKDGLRVSMGEKERRIAWENVCGVVFAATGELPPPPKGCGAVRALLKDSNLVVGRVEGLEWEILRIRTPSGLAFDIPVSSIARLELGTDRIRYLSDMEPASVEETPFFGGSKPFRRDLSVGGRPIRIHGIAFEKGIGVHSRSRLTFEVPKGYRRFLARVGIDDETKGKGCAVFRVYVNGQRVLEFSPVRAAEPPKSVEVPLAGAATITLEVDFGEGMDIGDHADWADARIVKD